MSGKWRPAFVQCWKPKVSTLSNWKATNILVENGTAQTGMKGILW